MAWVWDQGTEGPLPLLAHVFLALFWVEVGIICTSPNWGTLGRRTLLVLVATCALVIFGVIIEAKCD